MSLSNIATAIRTSVAAELEKVQLPEGVEVSAEVKQQLADAGTRGTLVGLDSLQGAGFIHITGSEEEGNDDVASATPAEILGELFSSVNS